MAIRQQTSKQQISDYLDERLARVQLALVTRLSIVGEQVVNRARLSGSYTDQTGNLRSSVGYILVQDGVVIRYGDFAPVKDGKQGSGEGRAFAASLARRHNKGIALIVVAGMNYAYYVKKNGKDVLDSAELLADKLVPKLLRDLGFKQ